MGTVTVIALIWTNLMLTVVIVLEVIEWRRR